MLFSHDLVQICPGRIDSLTPYILPFVKHIVENLDTKVGHANLIDIRETHGKTDLNVFFVFHDCIDFISDVPGRFLDL